MEFEFEFEFPIYFSPFAHLQSVVPRNAVLPAVSPRHSQATFSSPPFGHRQMDS